MSAASDREIADLNASLALDGEWIELRRLYGTQMIPVKVTCRAFVRNVGAEELQAGITQEQSNVILGPSEIIATGWPGPWTPSAAEPVRPDIDRRVPRKGDKCVIQGKPRNIEISKPIYVDNELVRIELRVLG
jgi:hypothetical protein